MSTVVDLHGRHLPPAVRLHARGDPLPDRPRAAELKAASVRGARAEARRQGDRADLREGTRPGLAARFEVAALRPGRHVTFMGPSGSHMGHKETAKDTARVLGACTTRSSSAASPRKWPRSSRSGPASPSTTVSLTSGTRRRCLPTSSPSPSTRTSRSRRSPSATWATPLQHGGQLPRRRGEARHGRPDREPEEAWPRQEIVDSRTRPLPRQARRSRSPTTSRRPSKARTSCSPTCGSRWRAGDDVWKERIELLMP